MRIKLNLQIFIFITIFIFTNQIKIYSIIMLFTCLHECAHLIAGVFLKFKPKDLQIHPFGLAITFEIFESQSRNNLKMILVSVMGPFFNLIVSCIIWFVGINSEIKELIFYSNILILTFNILPIYPLDGGRILKGLLKAKKVETYKIDKAINKTSYITIILITAMFSILILVLKNIALLFIIIYLWIIVIKENKKYRLKKSIYDIIKKENYKRSIACKNDLEETDDKK